MTLIEADKSLFREGTVLVVTGAAGFMGEHAIRYGLKHYPAVIASDIRSVNHPIGDADPRIFSVVEADLADQESLKKITDTVEQLLEEPMFEKVVIWHMGGVFSYEAPEKIIDAVNRKGTRNMVEAVALPLHDHFNCLEGFVYWSGLTVFGDFDFEGPAREDMDPTPSNVYGWSKLRAEELLLNEYHELTGLSAVVIRPSGVYGPGGPENERQAMADGIKMVADGNPNLMPGKRPRRTALVHVEDVIRCADFLANCPDAKGEAYNVTDDKPYWLREVNGYLGGIFRNPLIEEFPLIGEVYIPEKLLRFALKWIIKPLYSRYDLAKKLIDALIGTTPGFMEMSLLDSHASNEKLWELAEAYGRGRDSENPLLKWPDSRDGLLQTAQEYADEGFVDIDHDPAVARVEYELGELLSAGEIDMEEVSEFLDGLTHNERVAAIRSLDGDQQERLFEAAGGFATLSLTDMVPPETNDLVEVRHIGKNSVAPISALSHFEKRFARPEGEDPQSPTRLIGYNFQAGLPALSKVTGPGYFSMRRGDNGEILIDYTIVPVPHCEDLPEEWPEPQPNDSGISKLVFGNMLDTLRKVSEHVTVGSAAKIKGYGETKDMNQYFLLCRKDD